MGDTGGQGSATGDGDAVNSHIHMPQTGNGSTVGGPTTNAGGLHAGNMLGGGMQEEIAVVNKVENRIGAEDHARRGTAGGTTEVSGQGRGIRRTVIKVREEDCQREPGNVQVDKRP